MRRKEKAIEDRTEIDAVINRCEVCRLGLCDGDRPYVVPLNFGYDGEAIWFHSALEGRKVDLIRRNNKVCFVFDTDHEMVQHDKACGWSMNYSCVMGTGRAILIEDAEAKREGLDVIMAQHSDKSYSYEDKVLKKTLIIKIEIETLSGKVSK